MERPRGLAVWAGLDPFGAEVVSRLQRWLTDDPAGQHLAAANRLLPSLPLAEAEPPPAADHAGRGISPARNPVDAGAAAAAGAAVDAIQRAIGDLLADRPSRDALAWADRDLLVPHIWLVADLASPEMAAVAPWLACLHRRLEALQVEARVYLLLRNRSWARATDEQAEIERRVETLVTTICAPRAAGEGRTLIFVVSDRDGIGGRYSEVETTALAQRFTDLILLGDIPHRNLVGAAEVFIGAAGGVAASWELLPVFASFAGEALHWDAPALFRENAERRRQRLFAALEAPVAATFDPPYPILHGLALGAETRWPKLDLPRWSPRFWRSAAEEHVQATEVMNRWLAAATQWRHEMLVVHEDRRAHLAHRAEVHRRQYIDELDALTRTILTDDSLPGYFAPLRRLYERARAELRVRLADVNQPAAPVPVPAAPALDPAQAATDPGAILAGADNRLVEKLERKVNPLLLLQVAVATFLLAWGWTVYAAHLIGSWRPPAVDAFQGASAPSQTEQADPAGAPLVDQARDWLITRGDAVLPDLPGLFPSTAQVALWAAVIYGAVIAIIATMTALRQRVVLERAWKIFHDRARRWRDRCATTLRQDVAATELELARSNLDAAIAEVEDRIARLEELRSHGRRPADATPPPDPALSGAILPAKPPPPPLTELQVAQIVSAFRHGRQHDPALRDTAEQLADALYLEAARVAGDPEPDLHLELPMLRRRVAAAMPPAGAVRVQQLETATPAEQAPPLLGRFVATPHQVAAAWPAEDGAMVVPLPSDDRFYALVIQSGMSARRILSLPADMPASNAPTNGVPVQPAPAAPEPDPGGTPPPTTADTQPPAARGGPSDPVAVASREDQDESIGVVAVPAGHTPNDDHRPASPAPAPFGGPREPDAPD